MRVWVVIAALSLAGCSVGGSAATTEQIAEESAAHGVAVAGGFVYWVTATELRRRSIAGGPTETVHRSSRMDAIGARGDDLFVGTDEGIARVDPRSGAVTVTSVRTREPVSSFAFDDTHVYFAANDALRMPLGADYVQTVFSSGRSARPVPVIAVDEQFLYWAGDGIFRVPKEGGTATSLSDDDVARGLAVVGESIVYSTGDDLGPPSVKRMAKSGGAAMTLAAANGPGGFRGGLPEAVGVVGDHVVFTSLFARLFAVRLDGSGSAVRLWSGDYSGPDEPSLFVDGRQIYWTNHHGVFRTGAP